MDEPTLKRYDPQVGERFYGSSCVEMTASEGGEWVKYEDVMRLLRFWGGYIQGHREMLEDMKLHPKIIAAVRKAEKAFNEFGNE